MKITYNAPDRSKRFRDARNCKLDDPFTWNGSGFQINFKSQFHIATRALNILKAQINNDPLPNLVWRTVDNTFYQFTDADEFLAFATAVDNHVEQIMFESWQHIDN